MITRVVRMSFSVDTLDQFEALFAKHQDAISAVSGCQKVELQAELGAPQIRVTISQWDSLEALDAYRKSALFGEVWPATKLLFSAPPTAHSFVAVQTGT
ncbi:MAG: antibiotic biosynthesis monooxygenase [Flavobacteriales bacterium]|nr:antibiotic biosynthesis monooxygenase [Flavobacteriales bacterium]